MTLTMAIKIIRSMGFANAISLLRDRLCKTQSNKFNTLRDFFIGIGLEIGGPSKVFSEVGYWPVYHLAIRIDNVNFREVTTWHGSMTGGNNFVFSAHQPPGRQYIGNAGDLTWIADAAYDFLLSSHMLEHSANPLKVLLEWKRVLKTDGVMVLVLPHKDGGLSTISDL
jgi:SAM-dependent methyltransferase